MTTLKNIFLATLIAASFVAFTTQEITPVMPPRVEING